MSINWNHPDNSLHLGIHSPTCFSTILPTSVRKLRVKRGFETSLPRDLYDKDSTKTWHMKCVENRKSRSRR